MIPSLVLIVGFLAGQTPKPDCQSQLTDAVPAGPTALAAATQLSPKTVAPQQVAFEELVRERARAESAACEVGVCLDEDGGVRLEISCDRDKRTLHARGPVRAGVLGGPDFDLTWVPEAMAGKACRLLKSICFAKETTVTIETTCGDFTGSRAALASGESIVWLGPTSLSSEALLAVVSSQQWTIDGFEPDSAVVPLARQRDVREFGYWLTNHLRDNPAVKIAIAGYSDAKDCVRDHEPKECRVALAMRRSLSIRAMLKDVGVGEPARYSSGTGHRSVVVNLSSK